jgi:transcriptional regulator with XRE-family HTH domain
MEINTSNPEDNGAMTKAVEKALNKRIGANLKAIREFRGVSQQALAEAAGVSFQQLQKYETGFNRITGGKFVCFSKKLKVPVSAFFEGVLSNTQEAPAPAISKRL